MPFIVDETVLILVETAVCEFRVCNTGLLDPGNALDLSVFSYRVFWSSCGGFHWRLMLELGNTVGIRWG